MDEDTCRICRGEGTEDAPLFYPCKCRGSIKYIHQDCLEEWLRHSNQRNAKCDICHTVYKFRTVYKENTPQRVPVSLVLDRWARNAQRTLGYVVGVTVLVLGCGVQIPLCWAVVSRLLTYTLNEVPVHEDFFVALVYGDAKFEGDPWDSHNLLRTFYSTYTDSLMTMLLLVCISLLFFMVNERVTTDPGFKALVDHNIGSVNQNNQNFLNNVNRVNINNRAGANVQVAHNAHPMVERYNLLDNVEMLEHVLEEVRDRGDEPTTAIIRELQDAVIELREAEGLNARRLLQRIEGRLAEHQNRVIREPLHPEEDSDVDPDFVPDDSDVDSIHSHGSDGRIRMERFLEDQEIDRQDDDDDDNDDALVEEPLLRRQQQQPGDWTRWLVDPVNQVPDIPNIPRQHNNEPDVHERVDNDHFDAFPPMAVPMRPFIPPQRPMRPVRPRQPREDNNHQHQHNGDDDDFNQEALIRSLSLPMIIVAADLILILYLLSVYFMPTLIGTSLVHLMFFLAELGKEAALVSVDYMGYDPQKIHMTLSHWGTYTPQIVHTALSYLDSLVDGLKAIHEQDRPLSNFERSITLLVFFISFWLVIYTRLLRFDAAYRKTQSPLSGIQRKVYVVFFGLLSTIKVFSIFAVELVVFPSFCGALLVFVLSPLESYDTNWPVLRG